RLTPLGLQKLLYLAQANYLAATNERLFDEDIEAFENGPVVYRAWRHYRQLGNTAIASSESFASEPTASLSSNIVEFLSAVWQKDHDYPPSQLVSISQEPDPWKAAYVPGEYRTRIPDDSMRLYFRDSLSPADRVLHPDYVLIPPDFMESLDSDEESEAKLRAFL